MRNRGTEWSGLEGKATARDRERMVQSQIIARGVRDSRVLEATRVLPRHLFVPPERAEEACEDHPLAITCGQTISQPYIVALMLELLEFEGSERVLEIGTGSGYQTALLALLATKVFTVERHAELTEASQEVLNRLGLGNVEFRCGDGSRGWAEHAPFDRIILSAATPVVAPELIAQIGEGGRLIAPVGSRWEQSLKLFRKRNGEIESSDFGPCVFVPLVGEGGFKSNDS